MDRFRSSRNRHWLGCGHEGTHRGRIGERRERRCRAHARQGRVQAAAQRAGHRAVEDAEGRRSGVPRSGDRRHQPPREHAERHPAALALHPGHDLEGRALRARLVRDPRHVQQRQRQGRADPERDGRRPEGAPGLRGRRGRRRQLLEGLFRHAGQGLREGRAALAADHAADPRHRIRRTPDRRHPRRARHERGARGTRPDGGREPAPARDRRHAVGDPADRARGRRRLLDLLHRPRAPGARERRGPARRHRDRRGHVGSRRARLRPHRDGRDERHVPGRQRRVLGHRPGHDPGRRDRHHRLADRAPRAARAQVGGLPRPHPGPPPGRARASASPAAASPPRGRS